MEGRHQRMRTKHTEEPTFYCTTHDHSSKAKLRAFATRLPIQRLHVLCEPNRLRDLSKEIVGEVTTLHDTTTERDDVIHDEGYEGCYQPKSSGVS